MNLAQPNDGWTGPLIKLCHWE